MVAEREQTVQSLIERINQVVAERNQVVAEKERAVQSLLSQNEEKARIIANIQSTLGYRAETRLRQAIKKIFPAK